MQNYTIVQDEDEVKRFINLLPELKKGEVYFVMLVSRNKHSIIKKGDIRLNQFISGKEFLFNKIKQLEIPLGNYITKKNEQLNNGDLTLYINPNPRNIEKASKNLLHKLATVTTSVYGGYNLISLAFSELMSAKSYSRFVDFDIDFENNENHVEIKTKVEEFLGKDVCVFVKTRGGMHVLVDTHKIGNNKNTFFKFMKNNFNIDSTGDNMIPLPGCIQGEFKPVLF